jgi:hypothetical protein
MGRMITPPLLRVALSGSYLAASLVSTACLSTALLVAWLPLSFGAQIMGVLAIGTYAIWLTRRWAARTSRGAIVGVEVGSDQHVTFVDGEGGRVFGELRGDSYVSAFLTTIVMHPRGAKRARTVAIIPGMLPDEDFRRLRVLLRFAQKPHVER